jgi:hypothetical protein
MCAKVFAGQKVLAGLKSWSAKSLGPPKALARERFADQAELPFIAKTNLAVCDCLNIKRRKR